MSSTAHSMGKDDVSPVVRAGLHAGLVGWRSVVAAAPGALDGANDTRQRKTAAEIRAHAAQRVRRWSLVDHSSGRDVRCGQLEVVALVARLESNAGICRIALSCRVDTCHTFTA